MLTHNPYMPNTVSLLAFVLVGPSTQTTLRTPKRGNFESARKILKPPRNTKFMVLIANISLLSQFLSL
jgi:hypothetical protein